MKKQLLLLAVLIASVSVFGFLGLTEKKDVLAKVGRKSITRNDIEARIDTYPEQFRDALKQDQNMQRILQQVINEEVLLLAAQKEGISTSESVKAELEKQRKDYIINEVLNKKINNVITISDEEVKAYYDQNEAQFGPLETRRARHILVEKENEARRILRQINNGANFAEMAKRHSQDNTKENGGDLGYFRRGQLVKPFENTAFKLKKGQVSDIVKSQYGYHIIKLEDIRVRPKLSFEDVKETIKNQLLGAKRRQASDQYIKNIREEFNVKIIEKKKPETKKEKNTEETSDNG
jgi:peptidyl-prolyl cis-trans isomerase C